MKRVITLLLLCLLVCILIGCKAKKEFIEVEKWQRDTLTIVDTVKITEYINVKDSTSEQSQTQLVQKDSTITVVHWNYVTYDSIGNITSMLDFNSHTQHGNLSNTTSQSESTSTNNSEYQKQENASHSERGGHSEHSHETKETKPQLNWCQKLLMWWGAISMIGCALAIAWRVGRRKPIQP